MRHFVIVDVFAEEKYAGNQLAVILDSDGLEPDEMQRIARETNFSETTFLISKEPTAQGYAVRIFTPTGELPFAGHPTLGTAWAIRREVAPTAEAIDLDLRIGRVGVTFKTRGDGAELVWMRTPQPTLQRILDRGALASVVGLTEADLDPLLPVQEISIGVSFTFIPLRGLEAIRRARFDRVAYDRVSHLGFHPGLFLFCGETCDPVNQLHARMFCDAFGITEDPAMGSANACLAAYFLEHSRPRRYRIEMRVEQGFEIARPSLLHVNAERQGTSSVIDVGGRVVLSARGELV